MSIFVELFVQNTIFMLKIKIIWDLWDKLLKKTNKFDKIISKSNWR